MSKKNAETLIQNEIQAYLDSQKIYNIRVHADGTTVGEPDLIVCFKGRFVGLEVKTKTGKPSGIQEAKGQIIKENGGYHIYPTSVEDVKELFTKIEKEIYNG